MIYDFIHSNNNYLFCRVIHMDMADKMKTDELIMQREQAQVLFIEWLKYNFDKSDVRDNPQNYQEYFSEFLEHQNISLLEYNEDINNDLQC